MTDPKYSTWERMRSGEWYLPGSAELEAIHTHSRTRLKEVNELANLDFDRANELLAEILAPESQVPEWWAPMQIEYGRNTTFGEDCYVNVHMTILDSAPVTVGDRTLFGPNCELITVNHPLGAQPRREGWEQGQAITIGDDCWFGSRVTVLPGVTIGDRSVIGAGAVVAQDIADDSLAVGVPAKVVRTLNV